MAAMLDLPYQDEERWARVKPALEVRLSTLTDGHRRYLPKNHNRARRTSFLCASSAQTLQFARVCEKKP